MSEQQLIEYGSPTLAGLKTGSLFSCLCVDIQRLYQEIRELNCRLKHKGLIILPLKIWNNHALIYLYRPSRLKTDLLSLEAAALLSEYGYCPEHCEKCILKLMERLHEQNTFPHEIGLFLGYPPEDVRGFITNHGKGCKLVGNWEVYGDETAAQKLFERYRKCTRIYKEVYSAGFSLEKLTISVQ